MESVRRALDTVPAIGDIPLSPDAGSTKAVSHNLNGQRLGRKGRDTRDRIIAAAHEILAESEYSLITLSEVARRASLRMGSLYLYFSDLTELVLAMLEPAMATVDETIMPLLEERWPDDELSDRAYQFVSTYHQFWVQYSRLLHLRNNMSDRHDQRMMLNRVHTAQPIMRRLIVQMDGDLSKTESPIFSMATALMTGLERVATVTTDTSLPMLINAPFSSKFDNLLRAESRLFEMGIRDYRALAAKG